MSYSREPSLCGFLCDISSDASEQLLLIESRSMLGAPLTREDHGGIWVNRLRIIFAWKDHGYNDSGLVPICFVAIFAVNWKFSRLENLSQRITKQGGKSGRSF
jgi:hypothetical protein